MACVCSVVRAYRQTYVNDEHDIYGYTYKPITERFEYHLQDITRATGVEKYGLIVSDHRGRDDDERVRRYHQMLMHSQSPYISAYDRLIESVFLTPSHTSVGIQLADLFAGAVSRAFNFNDKTWFDEVRSIFRSKRNGDIDGYGLVKFPTGW